MASTYSPNLKIELITTGEQSGTWGSTTNTNLGTLIEEAIAGYVTQNVTDSSTATTLTISNGASSNGRNYVIELLGTLTANRTVEVPAVDKPYIFFNNTVGGFSVTVKVSGQTGVTIAAGKKAIVYTNSTDVIEVVNAPVSETGTQTLTNKTLTSPTLTTPALGTPASGVLTNATGLPLNTGVTGTLPVANGGTGVTTSTGSGNNVLSTSPTLTTPVLGTPTSVTLTNGTGLPISTGVSGLGTGVATALGVAANTTAGGFPTIDGTATLTNKRVNPRVISITGAAGGTITPTGDTADQYTITALGAAATFAAPSGTPVDGQRLVLRIKDNGTARALTWTTTSGAFRAVGTTLPSTTVISKTIYVGCIYNSADTFWDVVGVASQA